MAEEPKHVHGENCNHDHDHDHEHDHDDHSSHDDNELDPSKKGNRGEKKFKKAMGKMGLKPVSGINRVTIKKGKAFVISIDDPDVWKTPGNESAYIIFGKPNLDGMQAGQGEMNQFSNPISPEGQEVKAETAETSNVTKTEEPAAEDLSEEGLTPENIKMVMEYAKCSKAEAIRVLRETNDDSVNAIMKLSK